MANSIELANTGQRTSRLGFGCSGLMGATSRKGSLRLLEDAFDAGVRHFDVAPMYGYGEVEGCVGEFLTRHRSSVTITTKFGIAPEKDRPWMNAIKRLGRKALRDVLGIRKSRTKGVPACGVELQRLPFRKAEAQQSLERSLHQLRTDCIDLWLLHEARAEDLQDETLLRFMEDSVSTGKIRAFGVGSESMHVPALLAERPRYCHTLQFEWSVFNAVLPRTLPFTLHHRALTEDFSQRHRWLVSDPARCRSWSESVGRDISRPSELAALMLRASLELNPESIVLFSSRTPEHIRDNVRNSEDPLLRAPALRLQQLASETRRQGSSWGLAKVV